MEPVKRLLVVLECEMSRAELQEALMLDDRKHFVSAYLKPALDRGFVEMTLPDKPNSSKQATLPTLSRRRGARPTIQGCRQLSTDLIVSRVWNFCTMLVHQICYEQARPRACSCEQIRSAILIARRFNALRH